MGVIAIRIYLGGEFNITPMADLRLSDGTIVTIEWTNIVQRGRYESEITGYTLIYDERPKCEWSCWKI